LDREWREEMGIEEAMVIMCKCVGVVGEEGVGKVFGEVVIRCVTKDGVLGRCRCWMGVGSSLTKDLIRID
jgi:20S proteasome alpha/beta subunit